MEEDQKLQKKKKKKQQDEEIEGTRRDQSSNSPPFPQSTTSQSQSKSNLHNHIKNQNIDMSSRSSLHSIPATMDSPPDSPTESSIPDSHGSSPHTIIPTPLTIATPSVASVAAKSETPFRVTSGVANGDFNEQKLGESRRRLRPSFSTSRESKWGSLVRKSLLGFRVSAFLSCLVSFSVMVSDRDKGWARDSFYKYKEFRFCLAANVIGFVYSGVQICDLVYLLSTSIRRSRHNLRYFLEFAFDQMIAYLLASASTSASIRVDDWLSNWGSDKFPDLAKASVSLSFVSFVFFAFCSLASGYTLCTLRSI